MYSGSNIRDLMDLERWHCTDKIDPNMEECATADFLSGDLEKWTNLITRSL